MVQIPVVHHVALTVGDLDASVEWYEQVFGIQQVLDVPHDGGTATVLADRDFRLVIGLHRHDHNPGAQFAETRSGLDHVSFRVDGREELTAWGDRLTELGVRQTDAADQPLTQAPIADTAYGSVLVFRDPDNIQLELIALPAA
ncbi:VOC family protein [Rhodococcus jostii]|uniref:Glyoxalase/Bleomycin resistance protein/Dioxygenase superfamily protein n=1 Tax=Rhodococcus jostii TaxID=132919 RepID=A0A1H4ZBR4_RHOJO|nr:VOC family protein [Rhodococcus jostii]SED26914.1 Glyoxalase/Bleomycin resistance protein/Dioxygenase superfamily protein [Rhodococcus jostii]